MGPVATCEEADMRRVENMENGKVHFRESWKVFEEDRMEVDAFGLDDGTSDDHGWRKCHNQELYHIKMI